MIDSDLINRIYQAFSEASRPEVSEIAPHQCSECERVRRDFAKFENREIPDEVLERNSEAVPLLSPKAFRYFLPRLLEYTLTHRSSNLSEFLLYHLAPAEVDDYYRDRVSMLKETERAIIREYLERRRTWPDAEYDLVYIEKGLVVWE